MEKVHYKIYLLKRQLKVLVLLVFLFFAGKSLFAFNGGTYTINSGALASASNYVSFTAFVNDLRNITRGDGGPSNYNVGGAGLQGSLTVDVATGSGPYVQQISIPAILGMSSTRTIVINGNGTTLSFTPTSTAAGGVLDLNGVDFLTVNNLNIVNNATFGYCLWVRNAADNNIFRNCNFRCPSMLGSTTGTAYIWISNGTTSPFSYTNAGNNNLFENNNLRTANSNGPYYGIVMVGPTVTSLTNASSGNRFLNNNIQNWRYCGFYAAYTNNTTFEGNTVHNTDYTITSLKYGIFLNYTNGVFDRNRLYNLDGSNVTANTLYPIYFYNYNNVTRNSTLNNNSVHCRTTGFNYNYIYNYASIFGSSLSIINNTFAHVSGTTVLNNSTTYVVYGGYWNVFRNNIISCDFQGAGTKYLYYDFSGSSPASFSHNNFDLRTSGTSYFGYVSGAARSNMSEMNQAGFPTNNINVDPDFINENALSDLHPTAILMANKGTTIPGLTIDLRGNTRSQSKPDVGAIEYTLNLRMTNFDLPLNNPVCAGYTSTIRGVIRNNSAFAVKGIQVANRLNNGSKTVLALTNVLNPGDSATFVFPNPNLFSQSGQNRIQLFSNNEDDMPSDDTLSKVFFVTPSPGGAVFTPSTNNIGIYDYQNRGYAVNPVDETMELQMTAPRKYSAGDYSVNWTNTAWVASASGQILPINTVVYEHNNNGKIKFKAPVNYLDSIVTLYIKVSDLQTSCDTVYIRKIVVAPKGAPKYILPSTLCDGSEIYFDNQSTVSSGQLTYSWNFGDGSPENDAISPVHVFPSFGSYTIRMRTITAPYGFTRDTNFVININEVPELGFKVVNACEGKPVKFNNTSYIGSGTILYTWDMGDGRGTSTATNPSYLYPSDGAYKVVLKAESNGCVRTMSRVAYAFSVPQSDFQVLPSSFCQNEEVRFKNTSTINYGSLGSSWTFDGQKSNLATADNPDFMFGSEGNKIVKLKSISEFGCVDSIEKTVTIKPAPIADFKADFMCTSKPSNLSNLTQVPSGLNAFYTWNFGDGNGGSSQVNPTVSWRNSGSKTIKMKVVLSNACSNEIVKVMNVGEQPKTIFTVDDKCVNEPIVFANKTEFKQGQIQYEWDFGDGFTSNKVNPIHQYNTVSSKTYSVRLVANVLGGCSDTLIKTVTVEEMPSACDFSIKRNYSKGLKAFEFIPLGNSDKLTFTWLTGDGNTFQSNNNGINYSYAQNTKYCVTMTARNASGCECSKVKCITLTTDIADVESMKVKIYPNPSNGVFNLEYGNDTKLNQVNVYDGFGKLIMSLNEEDLKSIDLTSYNSGVYYLEITTDQETISKKITLIK
jgi:parallel beta-helix repeat protein